MPDAIPGEWLSAATLAIEAQPSGTPAARLAMAALEAVVPLMREAGTAAEWGVRFSMSPGDRVESEVSTEEGARTAVANMRDRRPEFDAVLVRRTPATPPGKWEEVPDA